MIITKERVKELEESLNKKHRCMKCKHWSAVANFIDGTGPIINGTCTKCDKDIVANDPANEVPDWCPGYETMECISDVVNEAINVKADPTNPYHYKNSTSLECIEAMEIIFGKAAVLDFCACNAWKYIWRWKNKNGAEDLDKALWYAKRGLDNRYMDEPNYDRLKPILIEIGGYICEIKRRSENNED